MHRLSRGARAVVRHRDDAPELRGGLFETASHVHDVAQDRELDASLHTEIADDYRTEMDADCYRDLIGLPCASLGIPPLKFGLQCKRARNGARRGIRLFPQSPEGGHEAVAQILVQRPSMAEHYRRASFLKAPDQPKSPFRRETLVKPSEASCVPWPRFSRSYCRSLSSIGHLQSSFSGVTGNSRTRL